MHVYLRRHETEVAMNMAEASFNKGNFEMRLCYTFYIKKKVLPNRTSVLCFALATFNQPRCEKIVVYLVSTTNIILVCLD